jgi:Zn-dependent alcohol dehydrogenase
MALDILDGDTGDVIVSEVRKKKRPRHASKVMFTTYETWHGTTHGGSVGEQDDPEEF